MPIATCHNIIIVSCAVPQSSFDSPLLQYGTIRYGGTPEFATGQWAGIELDDDIGKNDGSYAGIRYFSCKMKYGV